MLSTALIPQGYSVTPCYGGTWKWESVLAPECHSGSGYATYEEAVAACRKSNGL